MGRNDFPVFHPYVFYIRVSNFVCGVNTGLIGCVPFPCFKVTLNNGFGVDASGGGTVLIRDSRIAHNSACRSPMPGGAVIFGHGTTTACAYDGCRTCNENY